MDQDSIKENDLYSFVRADDFFGELDSGKNSGIKRPIRAEYLDSDQMIQLNGEPQENPVCGHGKIFRLYDYEPGEKGEVSFLLLQFIRPRVWKIRLDPNAHEKPLFSDYNTRNIISSTTKETIEGLDRLEGDLKWGVDIVDAKSHFVVQSVWLGDEDPKTKKPKKTPEVQLWLQKSPLQITAVRLLENSKPVETIPSASSKNPDTLGQLRLNNKQGFDSGIIYQTQENPFQYWDNATILSEHTSPTAQYLGFGEQGGQHLFKNNTYMNYFNFDNMKYQNVYGKGPLDDREPLYHSEPYWMEVASHTAFRSHISTMVDNYSQTCVDLHTRRDMGNIFTMRIATRFNEFSVMKVAADSVSELIQSYTSIVGKPRLKPRYALGYHQGCYGVDTRKMVLESVDKYHASDFPIDGYHIDVDMQRDYKTFTIDSENRFKDPEDMFKYLRQKGVKCSTNITPHINSREDDNYATLQEMQRLGFAIKDRRKRHPSVTIAQMERYLIWDNGKDKVFDPNGVKPDYVPPDTVPLSETWNTGKEYRGGVYYGTKLGAPAYYPNLNNWAVRDWWGKQYQYLFETGLEFVWQDMTSPCIAEQYGDMKSLPFRLLLDRDVRRGEVDHIKATGFGEPVQKTAIELWSLYSYNLHKATYRGLQSLPDLSSKLKWRKDRRNFIIGRGSMIGSQRYAGLWTGDNESSWDFLTISVNQVLALGLSGITISGQDVGGFESAPQQDEHCDPQLLIRWYGAYSLLPWFRNHYTLRRPGSDRPNGVDKPGKKFQEPYNYLPWFESSEGSSLHGNPGLQVLYRAVLPVCRWYIQLRYSLMQLLYDAMFENVITGLPIARSMVITDDQDKTLFSTNQAFTSSQYLVGNDLLVAPRMTPEIPARDLDVYLPYPDSWFQMNLRPMEPLGAALLPPVQGGRQFQYHCNISDQSTQYPYITPMFIREGAIIPKIEVRMSTPDFYPPEKAKELGIEKPKANPVTFHIYPGKDNVYKMYVDDGISMESEPLGKLYQVNAFEDRKAEKYCEVKVEQVSSIDEAGLHHRDITINSPYNGYDSKDYSLEDIIDTALTVVVWHKQDVYNKHSISVDLNEASGATFENNDYVKATVIRCPNAFLNDKAKREKGVTFKLTYEKSEL